MAKGKYEEWITPEGLERVEEMAARLTDVEMARAMGISPSTFYAWFSRYPEISEAVTRGRAGAQAHANNEQVEESLLKKALGYTVQVKKTFKVRKVTYNKDGRRQKETEELKVGYDEVHVPADTAAIRFWLTNRMSERWKNKADLEANVTSSSVEDYLRQLAESGGDDA